MEHEVWMDSVFTVVSASCGFTVTICNRFLPGTHNAKIQPCGKLLWKQDLKAWLACLYVSKMASQWKQYLSRRRHLMPISTGPHSRFIKLQILSITLWFCTNNRPTSYDRKHQEHMFRSCRERPMERMTSRKYLTANQSRTCKSYLIHIFLCVVVMA